MTLGRAVARTVAESRSLENPAQPLTSTGLIEVLGGVALDAGVPVTPTSSLQMSAVWRANTVTAAGSAALPLHAYLDGTRNRVASKVLADPHPEMTRFEVWFMSFAHRNLWGDSCIQKIRNRAGQIVELWPIRPHRVIDIERHASTSANPGGKLFKILDDNGRGHELTTKDILHIPHLSIDGVRGMSPIAAARQGISLSQAAKRSAAKFFGRGAQMTGVLQTDRRLDPDQAKAIKDRWRDMYGGPDNAGDIGVLDSGAKFQSITMPFKDAQHLESRQYETVEIARFFGVPLFLMLETSKTTSWGTGLEQQALGYVQFDLSPVYLTPTEQRITKELLPTGQYSKYALQGLMRGDSAARAAFYRIMREVGGFSANDIRDLEDLPPIDGGDTYLQPMNMAPLGADPEPTSPAGPPPEDDEDDEDDESDDRGMSPQELAVRTNALGVLVRSGFDAKQALGVTGLPAIDYLPVRPVTVQPIAAAEGTETEPKPTAPDSEEDDDNDPGADN